MHGGASVAVREKSVNESRMTGSDDRQPLPSPAAFEGACEALEAFWLEVKGDASWTFDEFTSVSDRLTEPALMAMEELADVSRDPWTKVLASLYAFHIMATDMDFADLLARPRLVEMAARAMESWTVRDPILQSFAWDAQDALAAARPGAPKPKRPAYKPFWDEPGFKP